MKQTDILDEVFASGLVRDYSIAVDGGANVGDWTSRMLDQFDNVYAFDPAVECCEHLHKRFPNGGVHVFNSALLDRQCRVSVVSPNRKPFSQKRYVEPSETGDVSAIPLDMLDLKSCGLIKLDVEGAEGLALLGAANTIQKHRPVLIVEFAWDLVERFGHTEDSVLRIVKALGYRHVMGTFPDRVFVHEH